MEYLLFTLSCFIGFSVEFSCEPRAMPRANHSYLECVVRGRERVSSMNDLVYPNQYGDQIVAVCLPWKENNTLTENYIPLKLTASQIQAHTQQQLITLN